MDRLILVSSQKTIEDYFNENVHDHNLIYNGFPSCRYPISLANGDLEIMQWGYYYPKLKTCFTNIPVSNKIIFDKRFQISIRTQRCIIPCNCVSLVFNGRRFLIYVKEQRLFGMAGIYTKYVDSNKKLIYNFGILTRPATGLFHALGKTEEPIILHRNSHTRWLKKNLSDATCILDSENNCQFEAMPIVSLIDDISINTKDVLQPIGDVLLGPIFKDTAFKKAGSVSERKKKNGVIGMSLDERIKNETIVSITPKTK